MPHSEEHIAEAKKDFLEKADNFKELMKHQTANEDLHWKTRLAFVAFIGVLLTIVFSHRQDFSERFVAILSLIVFVAFAVIVLELIRADLDLRSSLKKQETVTKLAKIRHIATLEDRFVNYGKAAEHILIEDGSIRKRMLIGDPLSEIIKPSKNLFFWFSFVVWPLLYLGLAITLLIEGFHQKV